MSDLVKRLRDTHALGNDTFALLREAADALEAAETKYDARVKIDADATPVALSLIDAMDRDLVETIARAETAERRNAHLEAVLLATDSFLASFSQHYQGFPGKLDWPEIHVLKQSVEALADAKPGEGEK